MAEAAEPVVVHHDPIRIPVDLLPVKPRAPRPRQFSTTFVLGTAAAPWFAAAGVSGDPLAVSFALVWLAVILLDLVLIRGR